MSVGRRLLLTFLLFMCSFADAQTLSTQEVLHMPQAKADRRVAYGSNPLQFGDIRMPRGTGTFPISIIIHGGCWSADYDLNYMGNMSAALAKAGVATWTIEYRRVGDNGGG